MKLFAVAVVIICISIGQAYSEEGSVDERAKNGGFKDINHLMVAFNTCMDLMQPILNSPSKCKSGDIDCLSEEMTQKQSELRELQQSDIWSKNQCNKINWASSNPSYGELLDKVEDLENRIQTLEEKEQKGNAQSVNQRMGDFDRYDYIYREVNPYKLNVVHQLKRALHRHMKWVDEGLRPSIEIKFDGKTSIAGNSNAYINPLMESGILHIRSVLEFAGLKRDKLGRLTLVEKRYPDDVGVEILEINRKKLEMIDINKLQMEIGDKADLVLDSLSFVMWLANKFVAHFTTIINHDRETLYKMLVASQATPLIIANHVYVAQGLQVPAYKNANMP